MEKKIYSTSELLFSNRCFWFLQNNEWKEFDSLRVVLENVNFNNSPTLENSNNITILNKFLQSNFWKFFSKRMWQQDDFKFKGIAGVLFMKHSNRFNVKFNPLKFYELYIEGVLNQNFDKEQLTHIKENIKNFIEKNEKLEIDIPGINLQMLKELYSCHKQGEWDEKTWKHWNNFLINDLNVLRNLVSAFIHEYLHVILSHISGREKDRNKIIWNYATDYAINQSCVFTKEVKKLLITDDNVEFFSKFKVSAIVYQYKTDQRIRKLIDENIRINQNDLFNSFAKNIDALRKLFHWDSLFILSSLNGKSADEYYNILLENPQLNKEGSEVSKVKGYDNHETWDIENFDGDIEDIIWGENDGDMEKGEESDGEAPEGKSEGNDGEEDSEDESKEQKTHSPIRGKKVSSHQHQGFDINEISKKVEIKNSIKEILNNLGVDVNDPDELQKGISAIPGLSTHSAYITNIFKVKTKNWKQMLQNFLTYSANVLEKDYTMSRESRIRADYYPGKKLEQGFECIFVMDTSGSIQSVDWNDFCNQIKKISKDFNVDKLRILQCHTKISFDEYVRINKINNMPLKETGGTMMQVAFERLKKENNRHPVILFTDGDIDYFKSADYPFKSVIFLSRGHSYNKERLEGCGFRVICQDEE